MVVLPEAFLKYLESDLPKEGELSVNPFWFQLWGKEYIVEMNNNYQIPKFLHNYIGFGSNGGNELLVFDSIGKIFTVPFIPMDANDAVKISDSWDGFKKLIVENK
jgi:hypothetical protein